jgi:hypothetical protein
LEAPKNGDRNYKNDDDDDDDDGGGEKDNCSLGGGTVFKFREINTSHKMLI